MARRAINQTHVGYAVYKASNPLSRDSYILAEHHHAGSSPFPVDPTEIRRSCLIGFLGVKAGRSLESPGRGKLAPLFPSGVINFKSAGVGLEYDSV